MTDVETATTTLNDLMDQREQLVARSAKLADERQQISYAALTGKDKAAQDRLKKLNDTHILAPPGGLGPNGTDNIAYLSLGELPNGPKHPHCIPSDITP